jgi:uncharacterized protein (DUF2141 family)
MLRPMTKLLSVLFFVVATVFGANADTGIITVVASPVSKTVGTIVFSLYNNEASFKAKENELRQIKIGATKGQARISIGALSPGFYALTVFHDENNDGEINSWGIFPTEFFGFSMKNETLWSEPTWNDVKFELKAGKTLDLNIRLRKH